MSVLPDFPPDELPAPSAEMMLLLVMLGAYVAGRRRKRGEEHLKSISAQFARELLIAETTPLRASKHRAAHIKALRLAAAYFDWYLPMLVASLPDE